MEIRIDEINRYPVKGLTAERLESVTLTPGQALPYDRYFALAPGSTAIDGSVGEWMPKTSFLMLMRDEKLARLETRFEDTTEALTVFRGGRQVAKGVLTQPIGRSVIEDFFSAFMGQAARGRVKVVEAEQGHVLSDHPSPVISIINKASVADMERVVGTPVDPRRFRGNLLVSGLRAWTEFDLRGKRLRAGDAVLEVTESINRCAATNVNPDSALRDLNIPKSLQRGYGHIDCGVYARVIDAGTIGTGDILEPI